MTREEEAVRWIQSQLRGGMSQDRVIEEMAKVGWDYRTILGLIEMAKNTSLPGDSAVVQPAPASVQAAEPARNVGIAKTGGRKTKLVVGITALAGILIAGGVYAYSKLTNPNPNDVLRKMMANMTSVGAFSATVSGTFVPPSSSTAQTSPGVTFALSGDFNMKDPRSPEYDLRIKGDTGFGSPFPLSIDGEVIYLGGVAYFKINPGTSIGPISLNMIADQWIEANPATLAATSSPLAGLKVQMPTSQLNITPEEVAKIKNLVKNTFFFEEVRSLPGETIDGVGTYHYGFKPDIAAISSLVRNIGGILGVSSTPALTSSGTSTIESTYASTTWEIWIGENDYLMRKLFVTGTPGSEMALTMTNYNNVQEILPPLGAKPIEDVLGTIFGSMMRGK